MERRWQTEIIRPEGCILLALSVLILPLRWVLAWAAAAACHEVCHLLAVRLCGGRIEDCRIGLQGAVITAGELSRGKELICVLAGPLGSLLLLLTAKWFPATAVCALFQSAYNLLPLYPLDGGRALRAVLGMLLPQKTVADICRFVEWICFLGIFIFAIWLHLGWMPILFVLVLFVKTKFGKIPCKPGGKAVQ